MVHLDLVPPLYKVDHQSPAQNVLMPRVLMNILVFEHGVHYRQTMMRTEVQQQIAAQVEIRKGVPFNHASPGSTTITHMGIEVPIGEQWSPPFEHLSVFQYPLERHQESWVLQTSVQSVGRNHSHKLVFYLQGRENHPFIHSNTWWLSWGFTRKPTRKPSHSACATPEW